VETALRFERLGEQHWGLRRNFDCGEVDLNQYLAERARKEASQGLTAVHVLYDPGRDQIAAYYTLSSLSVKLTDLPDELTKRLPRYPDLPAVLIGRLAVDSGYRGRGVGKMLMMAALAKIQEQSTVVGTFMVVVDAKNDKIVEFYAKFGFRPFADRPQRLFLPTSVIPSLIPS